MDRKHYNRKLYAVIVNSINYSICVVTVAAHACIDSNGCIEEWETFGDWYINPNYHQKSVFDMSSGSFGHKAHVFDSTEVDSYFQFISSTNNKSILYLFSDFNKARELANKYLDLYNNYLNKDYEHVLEKLDILSALPHTEIVQRVPIQNEINQIREKQHILKETKVLYLDFSKSNIKIYPMDINI